jgi:two-component system OmpR family response regulator
MRRFLVVEDDEQLADLLSEVCQDLCDAEVMVSHGDTAESLLQQQPDLAIIDVMLPERLGFDVICHAVKHQVPGLLISGYDEADYWCKQLGLPHLMKPFSLQALVTTTEMILADTRANIACLQQACATLRETVRNSDPIIGDAGIVEASRQLRNHRKHGFLR